MVQRETYRCLEDDGTAVIDVTLAARVIKTVYFLHGFPTEGGLVEVVAKTSAIGVRFVLAYKSELTPNLKSPSHYCRFLKLHKFKLC